MRGGACALSSWLAPPLLFRVVLQGFIFPLVDADKGVYVSLGTARSGRRLIMDVRNLDSCKAKSRIQSSPWFVVLLKTGLLLCCAGVFKQVAIWSDRFTGRAPGEKFICYAVTANLWDQTEHHSEEKAGSWGSNELPTFRELYTWCWKRYLDFVSLACIDQHILGKMGKEI